MECKKCGKEVKKTDKFCQYCGAELKKEETKTKSTATKAIEKKEEVKEEVVAEKVETKKSGNGLAIASMILGIIGIVLSLIIGPIAFLFPLLALIFGLCSKKSGFKTAGIVTSIVGFVIGIIYLILSVVLFSSIFGLMLNEFGEDGYHYATPYGEWTCVPYSSYKSNTEETTLNLKYNGTYIYGPKGDLDKNHYSGTFTYTSETDKNEKYTGKKFYDIKAPVTEAVYNGIHQSTYNKNLNMEMQLTNDYDEAIIMFYNTYSTYKCTK